MNAIYGCPESMIWSPAEIKNTKLRKCHSCDKVCYTIFARVYNRAKVKNYCTAQCYRKKYHNEIQD